MQKLDVKPASPDTNERPTTGKPDQKNPKPVWETPKIEDVSEQVMAQPYIRFT